MQRVRRYPLHNLNNTIVWFVVCFFIFHPLAAAAADIVLPAMVRQYFKVQMTDDHRGTLSLCRKIYYKTVNESCPDSLEARFALEWLIEACLAAHKTDEADELKTKLPQGKLKSLLMGNRPVKMLRAYGGACLETGNFTLGKHFLQRAVLICARPQGPPKIVITETIAELGEFLLHFGKVDEGLSLLQKAAEMGQLIEGESYRASMCIFRLGDGYLRAGKVEKARNTFSRFISLIKPQFPEKDRRIVSLYLMVAEALKMNEKWLEALAYYKLAYKALKDSGGALHRDAIAVLNGMGQVTLRSGNIGKATKIYRKALSVVVKVNGTSIHPSALPALKALESIYKKAAIDDKLLLIQGRIKKIRE